MENPIPLDVIQNGEFKILQYIRDVCDRICEAVPMIMDGDLQGAMNRYNRKG